MGVENNIPEGWVETSIGKVTVVESGGTPSTKNPSYWGDEIPWITPRDLSSFKDVFIEKGERSISIEGLENSSAKLLPKNTILFSSRAPIGYVVIAQNETATNQGFKNLICDEVNSHFKYFYYLMKYKADFIERLSSGSTFSEASGTLIKSIELNLPLLHEQKAIAKVLTAFDDKIELLQAQNKTLETMAQTIFKEWFGKYQVGDELPDGWRVGDIYNVLDVQYGYPFKSKLFNENKEGLPLIRIRDIRKGVTGFYTTESYEEEYIISSGDVLAGMDALFQPYLWSGGKGLLNQRACRFIPKDFASRIFVFEFMKPHLSFYEKTKVGTTVIHLGKGDLDFIETVIPDKESLLKFKDLTTPIEEKIINNQQEIQSLSKTRDTLLPKLMSGKVRVNNIKQTADA